MIALETSKTPASLSAEVQMLEARCAELERLCGEMIGTLNIPCNRDGFLYPEKWAKRVAAWNRQWKRIYEPREKS